MNEPAPRADSDSSAESRPVRLPIGFRQKSEKWIGMTGILFFGGMLLFAFLGGLSEGDPIFFLMSAFWLIPLSCCLLQMRSRARSALFFTPTEVTQKGGRFTKTLRDADVRTIHWGSFLNPHKIELAGSRTKIKIELSTYDFADRLSIIELVRSRFPERVQNRWPLFAEFANRTYDRVHHPVEQPADRDPDQPLREGEYLYTRKKFGWTMAAVILGMQVALWGAMAPLAFAQPMTFQELSKIPGFTLLLACPLALWIIWPIGFVWFPAKGRIRRKNSQSKLLQNRNRHELGMLWKLYLPFLLVSAGWIGASRFAMQRYLGFAEPTVDIATLALCFVALISLMGITVGLGKEAEENAEVDDDEVVKWNARRIKLHAQVVDPPVVVPADASVVDPVAVVEVVSEVSRHQKTKDGIIWKM